MANQSTTDQFKITEKKFLHDYHTAFYKLFRLPLDWVSADAKNMTICGREHCNPLCVKIMENATGSECCTRNDKVLIEDGMKKRCPVIHKCHAGFYDALIPIFSNEQYIGALCIGQFLRRNPSRKELESLHASLSFLNLSIDELKKYYAQTPKLSEEQSSGLLELIQVLGEHITEFYQQIRFWDSAKGSDAITLAQRYIRLHYNQPLTVGGIARAVGMSKSHLLHQFSIQTGTTPSAFLNSYRVEQAAELLNNSSKTINEIADICGFGNTYAMNRFFKKHFGCPPSDFRKGQNPTPISQE